MFYNDLFNEFNKSGEINEYQKYSLRKLVTHKSLVRAELDTDAVCAIVKNEVEKGYVYICYTDADDLTVVSISKHEFIRDAIYKLSVQIHADLDDIDL